MELCGAVIRGKNTDDQELLDVPSSVERESPRDRAAAAAEARARDGGLSAEDGAAARIASGRRPTEGPPEVVALHLVKRSDDDQMRRIYEIMNQANHVIDHYLQEMVFPTFLRYQQVKISASGQEIGGDILFKRRIGFSGTPSALLPIEMGQTLYEKGADGLMMSAMTDPAIVSTHVIQGDWTVESVLTEIATQPYETR